MISRVEFHPVPSELASRFEPTADNEMKMMRLRGLATPSIPLGRSRAASIPQPSSGPSVSESRGKRLLTVAMRTQEIAQIEFQEGSRSPEQDRLDPFVGISDERRSAADCSEIRMADQNKLSAPRWTRRQQIRQGVAGQNGNRSEARFLKPAHHGLEHGLSQYF
jgi:hypothetical protein